MKYGLALPYNQTRNIPIWAAMAEKAGWDGVFLGDAVWTEDPLVALAAAASATSHIRLGTMLVPVPLRHPWKIASEALALDRLSSGRMILGLGTGAVWMGWHAFPDVETGARDRAEMLEETIDIVTLFFGREPFDYDGKHFHLALTQLDPVHYPPPPIQQPRIPVWAPLIWPLRNSKRWILKCDGLFAEKWGDEGPGQVTPADVQAMKTYVLDHRDEGMPFDVVVTGKTGLDASAEEQDAMHAWQEAGATWWMEDRFGGEAEEMQDRIAQGPPRF